MSSDGIMVDSTSPVSGTVYDGVGKYMCIIYIIRFVYQFIYNVQLLPFDSINACLYWPDENISTGSKIKV